MLCDCRIYNDRTSRSANLHQCVCPLPAHSTALRQAILEKRHVSQVCQYPYSPDLAPCDFGVFAKLKSPLKVRRFVNATVTQYASSVNDVSLPTD